MLLTCSSSGQRRSFKIIFIMVPKRAQDYRIILHLFKLFSKTQSDRILVVIWRLALCVKNLVRNVSESFTGKGQGRHSPKLWTAKYLSFVISFCIRGLFSMTSLSKYFIQMSARQYHHVDRQKNLTHLTMSTKPVNWKHLVTIKSGFEMKMFTAWYASIAK